MQGGSVIHLRGRPVRKGGEVGRGGQGRWGWGGGRWGWGWGRRNVGLREGGEVRPGVCGVPTPEVRVDG